MPKSVAILGASSDRSKFGNKSVRAHAHAGYTVYPVNPRGGEIEGWTTYTSLANVPETSLTRISVYLPPSIGLAEIESIASKGCEELWLNPGSESKEVVAAARSAGLDPILGCSIVELGVSPAEFPE